MFVFIFSRLRRVRRSPARAPAQAGNSPPEFAADVKLHLRFLTRREIQNRLRSSAAETGISLQMESQGAFPPPTCICLERKKS